MEPAEEAACGPGQPDDGPKGPSVTEPGKLQSAGPCTVVACDAMEDALPQQPRGEAPGVAETVHAAGGPAAADYEPHAAMPHEQPSQPNNAAPSPTIAEEPAAPAAAAAAAAGGTAEPHAAHSSGAHGPPEPIPEGTPREAGTGQAPTEGSAAPAPELSAPPPSAPDLLIGAPPAGPAGSGAAAAVAAVKPEPHATSPPGNGGSGGAMPSPPSNAPTLDEVYTNILNQKRQVITSRLGAAAQITSGINAGIITSMAAPSGIPSGSMAGGGLQGLDVLPARLSTRHSDFLAQLMSSTAAEEVDALFDTVGNDLMMDIMSGLSPSVSDQ
jgi:hypothetical protein